MARKKNANGKIRLAFRLRIYTFLLDCRLIPGLALCPARSPSGTNPKDARWKTPHALGRAAVVRAAVGRTVPAQWERARIMALPNDMEDQVSPPGSGGDPGNRSANSSEEGGTVPPSDVIAEAIAAADEIDGDDTTRWEKWIKIGRALEVASREAMRRSGTNSRKPGKYPMEYNKWLNENPRFRRRPLDNKARAALLNVMERLPAIEARRATLLEDKRISLNHPVTVWRHFTGKPKGPKRTNRKPTGPSPANADTANGIDRSLLAKTLGMLGSNQQGEVLNAASLANKMLKEAGLRWQDVLGVGQ
jgi:hypothetical protein